MAKSALILGGGFLGGHAARAFAAAGWAVTGAGHGPRSPWPAELPFLTGELTDAGFVAQLLARLEPRVVLFTASPADVGGSFEAPADDFDRHLRPLLTLLEQLRRSRAASAVILISSAAVYGEPAALPISESTPAAPISPYGYHKVQQELLLDEYVRLHGVRGCKARVFSTFGPGLRRLAVYEILQRARRGDRTVLGRPGDSRDYLYCSDVARGFEALARAAPMAGEAINLAAGDEVPLSDLARRIFALVGIAGEPELTGGAARGVPGRWRADTSALRALGFEPHWTLDAALAETVAWARRDG